MRDINIYINTLQSIGLVPIGKNKDLDDLINKQRVPFSEQFETYGDFREAQYDIWDNLLANEEIPSDTFQALKLTVQSLKTELGIE